MPSLTTTIPELQRAGPNIEVFVSAPNALLAALAKAGQPAPPPVRLVAQVDTGASGTVIKPETAAALGLSPVSYTQVSTPSTTTPVQMPVYHINLRFAYGVAVNDIFATAAPLGGQNIQALIGRDVLRHGMLTYIGYINQFTLSF